ncbi:MAG: gephyrin-like molybdotransferase Glp [Myxococcota bacterium]|nr:gephyrin-like molybdotransferase Glp [Myxococcota bacterium]
MREGITPAEALGIVLDEVVALPTETVASQEALGRVLAESVVSGRRIPPADNSAMDGYAVRAADLAGAAPETPRELPVVFEVAAGATPEATLGAGEAARILTGAPLPPGADSVVRQEDVDRDGDRVRVRVAPALGEHVRAAGEDVEPGDRVLEAGTRLGAAHLGFMASRGRLVVAVRQRPQVAVLSGGDELVEPDGDVSGGGIVSSNSYSIAAQCRELGAAPVYLGIARDTPEDVAAHLRAGLGSDVLVSSAGVSVGDRDYVRGALEKLGCRLLFWGVQMKPGYPLAFGRFGERGSPGPLVFGLPGNPVSAMMTFEQFVRPALCKMMGFPSLFRPVVVVRLGEALEKKPGRLHFVRVRLEREGEEFVAYSTGNQSSGVLRSMLLAQGILIFPADAARLEAGESVRVQVVDPAVLAAETPGF